MKKDTLFYGIISTILGSVFIGLALIFEFQAEGYLWGFGGAGLSSGIMSVWKYIHWTKPENISEYNERLKTEKIELADERKIMLRDKSARITYMIMLGLYVALIMIFSVLSTFGYFTPFSRYLVIIFSVMIIVQFFIGIIAFSYLNKRL
ncbi:hypothetical protein SDC9_111984 [bioreactor metagenome]|uniref:DUF2178 domain-containing protein n=1 Tax=bioreactor metagenome TaxID=1076179 RepID=A0A645BIJ1_9ZZZZ